jgi:hypothetical protein
VEILKQQRGLTEILLNNKLRVIEKLLVFLKIRGISLEKGCEGMGGFLKFGEGLTSGCRGVRGKYKGKDLEGFFSI